MEKKEMLTDGNVSRIQWLISELSIPKEYFLSMLGPTSFKKAIEEAEKLSESLKLRLEVGVVYIVNTVHEKAVNIFTTICVIIKLYIKDKL